MDKRGDITSSCQIERETPPEGEFRTERFCGHPSFLLFPVVIGFSLNIKQPKLFFVMFMGPPHWWFSFETPDNSGGHAPFSSSGLLDASPGCWRSLWRASQPAVRLERPSSRSTRTGPAKGSSKGRPCFGFFEPKRANFHRNPCRRGFVIERRKTDNMLDGRLGNRAWSQ